MRLLITYFLLHFIHNQSSCGKNILSCFSSANKIFSSFIYFFHQTYSPVHMCYNHSHIRYCGCLCAVFRIRIYMDLLSTRPQDPEPPSKSGSESWHTPIWTENRKKSKWFVFFFVDADHPISPRYLDLDLRRVTVRIRTELWIRIARTKTQIRSTLPYLWYEKWEWFNYVPVVRWRARWFLATAPLFSRWG